MGIRGNNAEGSSGEAAGRAASLYRGSQEALGQETETDRTPHSSEHLEYRFRTLMMSLSFL